MGLLNMFFNYHGAVFYKFRRPTGDTFFVPL